MEQPQEGWLAEGRRALADGRWRQAEAVFARALEQEPTAPALAGFAEAAWWLGDTAAAVAHFERAHAAYLRDGEPAEAVMAAFQLYFVARISLGRRAVANGWLRRAARLVEEHRLEPLDGWILLLTAHASDDVAAAERAARSAVDIAVRTGDPDLELCARSQLGACLVGMGRIADGVDLLDETMAGALAGQGERLQTVVYASCNTVTACSRVAEVGRALQWIRAGHAFAERFGCPHVFTLCRVHHARLMFVTGDWRSADEHYLAALRTGRDAEPALHGMALAGLAELRLAQGRLEEAEELVQGLEGQAVGGRVRAALLLARGQSAAAAAAMEGAEEGGEDDRLLAYTAGAAAGLERAAALSVQAAALAAAGRGREALAVADRLVGLGEETGCQPIVAQADLARARALAAARDPEGAIRSGRQALTRFERLQMPLEAARCRLLLGEQLARRTPDLAAPWLRSALASFEDLGAGGDADRAAAVLRTLGVRASRRGPKGLGMLTKREREVLELLEQGLSNPAIAERLSISRRTVEHHVQSVLSKLGVRNRTEAALVARGRLPSRD